MDEGGRSPFIDEHGYKQINHNNHEDISRPYQDDEEVKQEFMNETSTSDFYQVPSQGRNLVSLGIDKGGRRPFTPPFAQLKKTPDTSTSTNTQAFVQKNENLQKVQPAEPISGVMSQEQKL